MATTAKAPTSTRERKLIPPGTHVATCYKFMNMGTRFQMFKGEKKKFPDTLVSFTFEVPGEKDTFTNIDGVAEEKPLVISREFTLSMGPKSNLRPFVEGMIGVSLLDEEAYAFDLESLVGKSCLVTVTHRKSADGTKTFANITGTAPLIKGMPTPERVNKSYIFNVNTATLEEIQALPEWIQDKVKISDEYKKCFGGAEDTPHLEVDAVPF